MWDENGIGKVNNPTRKLWRSLKSRRKQAQDRVPGLENKVEELDHSSKKYEKKTLKHTQTYACMKGMCRNHGTLCKDQIFKLYA